MKKILLMLSMALAMPTAQAYNLGEYMAQLQTATQAQVVAPQMTVISRTDKVLAALNTYRNENAAGDLTLDTQLADVAQGVADRMAAAAHFGHQDADGLYIEDHLRAADVAFVRFGENLGRGTHDADAIMVAWQASVLHNQNMLDDTLTHAGLGYAVAADGRGYWALVMTRPTW